VPSTEVLEKVAYPLRNGIIPTRPERITPRQAAECQPSSAERTVTLERLDGVHRTTWIITAGCRQQRRQRDLIRPYEQDEHGPWYCSNDMDDYGARRAIHCGNSCGSCVTARAMSVSSASNDASYASGRARMTTSTDSVVDRRRVRTSSRKRRFNRLRSTADPEYRGTIIPTRGCPRGEAIARTSRCMVRIRFPSRATLWSSTPRVSR
jgi:hypothetical protein